MTKKPSKARKVLEKPHIVGWKTSDPDEVELRRWRGRTEIAKIDALEPELVPYGTFRVRSGSGAVYAVEIRDLAGRTNSCGCVDHRVNGLGTCKHIEGVLFALRKKLGVRALVAAGEGLAARGNLSSRDGDPAPSLGGAAPSAEARAFLAPFLDEDGRLDPIRIPWRRSSRQPPARRPSSNSRVISAPGSSARNGSRPVRRRGRNSSRRSGRAAPASMWSSCRSFPISGRAQPTSPFTNVRYWQTLQRLADAGLIGFTETRANPSPGRTKPGEQFRRTRHGGVRSRCAGCVSGAGVFGAAILLRRIHLPSVCRRPERTARIGSPWIALIFVPNLLFHSIIYWDSRGSIGAFASVQETIATDMPIERSRSRSARPWLTAISASPLEFSYQKASPGG